MRRVVHTADCLISQFSGGYWPGMTQMTQIGFAQKAVVSPPAAFGSSYCPTWKGGTAAKRQGVAHTPCRNRLTALLSLMEAADESGLADDVAFHCVQNLGARRRGGQIQLGVERIELKHIVMKRPRTGARPEISSPADIRGGLLCAIRQISHRKAFLQSCGGARNIPDHPMQRIRLASSRRILNVMHDQR